MTSIDWNTAIAQRATHLAGLGKLPPPAARSRAMQAIAVVSLIAETGIRHALTSASTVPHLTISTVTGHNRYVDLIMSELTNVVGAPATGSGRAAFSAAHWIRNLGLDGLILRSVRHTADNSGRTVLLKYAARSASQLNDERARLLQAHMRALLQRDAPTLDDEWQHDADILPWVLAPEFNGDPSRQTRVQRRLQALRLYAALAHRLREPHFTAIIDEGRELAPALAEHLQISKPQLNALREATPRPIVSNHLNFENAVRFLQAHDMPLHQWPGAGRAAQPDAWHASSWLGTYELTLIRADYLGRGDRTTVRDAVRAFSEDLLMPLQADICDQQHLKLPSGQEPMLGTFQSLLRSGKTTPAEIAAARDYLACIRRAVVGSRGPKAFQEAAELWHRRAAAVAALRNEQQSDRPGWHPLCLTWTSPCGAYKIVPLTTAKELIEEGNAHEHCVGTYYDACRRGDTQILSLREHGQRVVTAEILLDERVSTLRVGQFKGRHDHVPDDPALHKAMRDFLRDLRTGVHPLNRKQLIAYRKWADDNCWSWNRRKTLSLDHAREAFPLYRALLPRGTPADFHQWCEQSGLRKGLLDALRFLTKAEVPLDEIAF